MSFESIMGACGMLIDKFIAWHLNLPWFYQIFLYLMYFTCIGIWLLKWMPREGPL